MKKRLEKKCLKYKKLSKRRKFHCACCGKPFEAEMIVVCGINEVEYKNIEICCSPTCDLALKKALRITLSNPNAPIGVHPKYLQDVRRYCKTVH